MSFDTTPRFLTAILTQLESGKVKPDDKITLFNNDYSQGATFGSNFVASVSKLRRTKDTALEEQERAHEADKREDRQERDNFTENQ